MKYALLTIWLSVIMGCSAEKVEPPKTEHLEASLISEELSIRNGTPFWVAVKLEMEEGWHVNWKNPGDAGLAPKIKWELPEGFIAGQIEWPTPKRLSVPPFVLFGYEDMVLLPVKITPPSELKNGQNIRLVADCEWVVCGDICLPGKAKLELKLTARNSTPEKDEKWAGEFDKVRMKIPANNEFFSFRTEISENAIMIDISPMTTEFATIGDLFLFPEQQGIINNAANQLLSKTKTGYHLEIERDRMSTKLPDILSGIIFVHSVDRTQPGKGIIVEIPLSNYLDSETEHKEKLLVEDK